MQCGSKVDFTIHSLTDEEWLSAIETSVALHYPEDIVDAVSYTHLDVYKRQEYI